MEVILLEKIHRLGALGDRVEVRPGYGRNYLIPQRKAVPATPDNVARFEEQRAELERAQADAFEAAKARAEQLNEARVTIAAKAGNEGKLFGSVGTGDIAEAFSAAGIAVEKREVRLPHGSLREVGEYQVEIHLHADVDVEVTVQVVSEDGVSAA
ncbi:MAG: 50S ribosomal protein L9 [Gammaproteobacteria bacterium]